MNKKLIYFIIAFVSSVAVAATTIQYGTFKISGGNLILGNQTASTVPYIDGSNIVQSSSTTPTELGFVHGATSSLCGINQSCTLTNKSLSGSSNTFTSIPLSSAVTGTLPVANGGTGQSSFTDGQVMIGNTATGLLSKANLTAGSNVTITNGNGSISIASTASGAAPLWSYVSQSSTLNPAVLGDYYLLSGASFTITLPTAVSVAGQGVVFRHNGTSLSQAYTLNTTSAQTINGVASGSYILQTNGETLQLVSDGSNWQIVNHITVTPWVDAGVMNPTSTSAYIFTITSSSVTAGAVYTNNSQNYYVTLTIASLTTLTASGTGAPLSSGTLTKVSGTGPATIAFSAVASSVPTKGTATITADHNWWRRVGNNMECRMEFTSTAAGTASAGTGDYLFWPLGSFNANLAIDTTALTAFGGAAIGAALPNPTNIVGNGWQRASTSTGGAASVSVYDSTKIRFFAISANQGITGGNVGAIGSALSSLASTSTYQATYSIPIVGWQP